MSPKITVHGGATNARVADDSPAASTSQPQVAAEGDLGRPTSDEGVENLDEVQDETSYEESGVDPYAGLNLTELRATADERGVPSYGTKAQIAERLREADAAASGGDVE